MKPTATGERQLNYAPGDDAARRFISLVDECYDRKTALYLQANIPLEQLYQGGALAFEFRRTHSRLVEMQSKQYLKFQASAQRQILDKKKPELI